MSVATIIVSVTVAGTMIQTTRGAASFATSSAGLATSVISGLVS